MRLAARLWLTVVGALVTALIAASNASAFVAIIDEGSGASCNPLCLIHMTNSTPMPMFAHIVTPIVTEVTISQCSLEIKATIDSSGEGWVDTAIMSGSAGVCTRQPCGGNGFINPPWPMHINEIGGNLEVDLGVCLEPVGGGTDSSCYLDLPLTQTGHEQTIGRNDWYGAPCFGLPSAELKGLLMTEDFQAPGETEIEVIHDL